MVKQKSVHGKDALKRKDASVIMHGQKPAVMDKHWQMDVSESVFPRGYDDDPAGAYLPRPAKDRPTAHKKVNEWDY